ncbi:MAG: VCBS repeat-containing protein [Planctomycetes bacterium]|nr:VCBS repeat-containing protein [Patescibacteria group bacterium]MBU4401062.1 VCBS repeat-containing protein [Planctomycetota bacterium]
MKEIEYIQKGLQMARHAPRVENKNIEIRNPGLRQGRQDLLFRTFVFRSFGFVSNFEFRASNLVLLVKAIQEQQAQIEALKQENQALKSGPLTADFDGDGKPDTAMVDTGGNWYVWLSGSGYVKSGPYNFGVTGKPVVDDFDGDGKADPGMVDANGNWYVWLSASGYSQSRL